MKIANNPNEIKGFCQSVNYLLDATIWEVDEGCVYITNKNSFLWKKDNRFWFEGEYDISLIKEHPLSELDTFKNMIKSEKFWAHWWVWKYYFNKKLTSKLETTNEVSCLRSSNQLFEEINDGLMTYSTYGIFIDKSTKNTMVFKYKKKDAYDAYKLITHYLMHLENFEDRGLVIEGVNFRVHDTIEFYRLIESKNKIKIILTDADYLQIKYVKVWLEEPLV